MPASGGVDPVALVSRLVELRDDGGTASAVNLERAVTALEGIRRLEAWLWWARHWVAETTARAAVADHGRWIETHPMMVDNGTEAAGLSRRGRVAVGERDGVAQIACALQVSEGAAHGLLERAELVTGHLPRTVAALEAGVIAGTAAQVIAEATAEYAADLPACVDSESQKGLERAIAVTEGTLLRAAGRGQTRAQLRSRERKVRERCHPRSFAERHAAAREDRFVRVTPDRDGMARLSALVAAAVAWRIDARLSALAREVTAQADGPGSSFGSGSSSGPGCSLDSGNGAGRVVVGEGPGGTDDGGDRRTLSQVRVDVLADLLAGVGQQGGDGRSGSGSGSPVDGADGAGALTEVGRPEPRVLVTVPAATLLGGDDPGWLGEFGPIPAVDARELASRARSFLLAVVADPADPPSHDTDPPPDGTDSPPGGTARPPEGTDRPADGTGPPLDGTARPADGTDPPPDGTARPPGEVGPPPGRTGRTSERDCRAGGEPAWVVPVALTTGLSYRLPAALRRALVVRDGTCRFPGCRRSAVACDVDHVRAWAEGGTTVPGNLAHLCRKHHVLKHHSGWSVTPGRGDEADERGSAARGVSDDGRASSRLRWTSPAGRAYVTDPDPPPF